MANFDPTVVKLQKKKIILSPGALDDLMYPEDI